MFLVRLDGDGDIIWERQYGSDFTNRGNAVIKAGDGGYIVTGYAGKILYPIYFKQLYVLKTDGSGDLQWESEFGVTGRDEGSALIAAPDGGFVVAGTASTQMYMVGIDESGNRLWERTLGSCYQYQAGTCIAAVAPGVYLVGGSAYNPATTDMPGHYDIHLVKTGGWSDVEFYWGGTGDDIACGMCLMADGHFMVVGSTSSYGTGGPNIYQMKINENGEFED